MRFFLVKSAGANGPKRGKSLFLPYVGGPARCPMITATLRMERLSRGAPNLLQEPSARSLFDSPARKVAVFGKRRDLPHFFFARGRLETRQQTIGGRRRQRRDQVGMSRPADRTMRGLLRRYRGRLARSATMSARAPCRFRERYAPPQISARRTTFAAREAIRPRRGIERCGTPPRQGAARAVRKNSSTKRAGRWPKNRRATHACISAAKISALRQN